MEIFALIFILNTFRIKQINVSYEKMLLLIGKKNTKTIIVRYMTNFSNIEHKIFLKI